VDTLAADLAPLSIVILRETAPQADSPNEAIPAAQEVEVELSLDLELVPVLEEEVTSESPTVAEISLPQWPSLGWEKRVLESINHLSLPRIIDSFVEAGFRYLVLEAPSGQVIWDAWEARTCTWAKRCGWLIQIAEALDHLHRRGALFEGLRPDMIVITPTGQAVIADLSDLLPLPLRPDIPLRGNLYSAPELVLNPSIADGRADLYSMGALIYSLLLGRELTELDFTIHGAPRAYVERFPDVHPLLGRLLTKTFVRDLYRRFPTEDTLTSDPSGFRDLIRLLEACQRNLDRVRLEIAAWTTTGVTRTGNEDAFAILHSAEAKLEDNDEFAVLLLADGMGGMESGEVASELAIHTLRAAFTQQPPLSNQRVPLTPKSSPDFEIPTVEEVPTGGEITAFAPSLQAGGTGAGRSPQEHQDQVIQALRESNRRVFEAARASTKNRGMGCTAEVVVIDGSQVVIGHVGDSRTYHLHRSKLVQISRDQTLVNRLVELGQLTAEEAEHHPRRSELQQAIGGRSEVLPETYLLTLQPGDWLLVCSDGLTNQLQNATIAATISESGNAERAARRLVNLANLDGSTDNVTVIVVRAH
jgi:protein phosphatase